MKRNDGIVGPAVKRKYLKATLDTGRFFFKKKILTLKAFRVDDGLINSREKEKGKLTHFQKELQHFTIET